MYLLTNVLDSEELSDDDAQVFYEKRWGIEVCFRSFKQTLNRKTLKSRTPETCLLETQLTLLGLWLLGLMSVDQITKAEGTPQEWSVARSRDVVRRGLRNTKPRGCKRPNLLNELAVALKDRYHRMSRKEARNYPRKKKEKPPQPPNIKPATSTQIESAQRLLSKIIPKQRTA